MRQKPHLHRIFPFLGWWHLVNGKSLKADLFAGITGAIMVLPQGVAFAMIAGLPPEYGLYTAIVPPIIAAIFGSSFQMVSGPATAISIVVFAALSEFAEPGSTEFINLAFALALYTGIIQLVLGLSKMGSLVNFVSHTVVIGFTAGAAFLIATNQIQHVLGFPLPKGGSFWEDWEYITTHFSLINVYVLLVGVATLLIAAILKKGFRKSPYLLIAIVLGSLISFLIGGGKLGINLVGEIPPFLPPPSVPDSSLTTITKLSSDALALALLGLIEAVAIARAIATNTQQKINGNQEFIGQGLSNIIGSFFSSYPSSGSFTRSGINYQAGAQTPLSSVFAALVLVLILLFIAPLTAYLPIPAMGGIILFVAYNLIDFHSIKTIIKTSKTETIVLVVTFLSALFLELEFSIYLGVFCSLIFYLQKTSKPRIVRMAPNTSKAKRPFVNIERVPMEECPQLLTIRIDGSLFFGAIDHVDTYFSSLREDFPDVNHVLVLVRSVNFLDLSGAEFLVKEAANWRARGGGLFLCGMKKPGREVLEKGGFKKELGERNMFESKQEAIEQIYSRLNKQICDTCEKRIFHECNPHIKQ